MPRMKFTKTHYKDGGDRIQYQQGRVYKIEESHVDKWTKRGAYIVPDTEQDDEVVEAQLDAGLAVELEQTGKGSHAETEEAIHHAAEVAGEIDEEEEFEDDEEFEDADETKSATKKKSSSKKRKTR
jgi:hypothetical protein